ncbi:MAG: hypothetical protein GC193_14105 [Cryomorphaceae bacterium]|nr:hypothetical protein [Cryomorphaceae bacterium]
MCTVSIVRSQDGKVVLTSNRDERTTRLTLPPDFVYVGNVQLLCPIDIEKGGTWIAAGSSGRVACLLNGAYKKHNPSGKETKSRGEIVMQVFGADKVTDFVLLCDLTSTEPFTLVVLELSAMDVVHEMIWDGRSKHYQKKSLDDINFWSSVTLYSPSFREKRQRHFIAWKSKYLLPLESEVFDLHASEDINDGFFLHGDSLQTVSITQVVLDTDIMKMNYNDCLAGFTINKQIRWERVLP